MDQNLLDCAQLGNVDGLCRELDRGARIEAADNNGWTALILAAIWGHDKVVQLLLDRGAQIEAANNGKTILMFAAEIGEEKVVQVLLDRGARIEAANEIGKTALMFAVHFGHEKVAQLLLDRGARIEAETKYGETALDLARKREQWNVVRHFCLKLSNC